MIKICPSFLILFFSSILFGGPEVQWNNWDNTLFVRAAKEKKLVVLDLQAVWCHWCHVMEEKTYHNPKVVELLNQSFIAVKVDQDARPDLSRRYQEYGWPATIFFDSAGREIAKRSGYQPPEKMQALIEKLIKNPVPEEGDEEKPAVAESPFLPASLKAELQESYVSSYDPKLGGWGSLHKFLFSDPEELALRNAWRGDKTDARRVRHTLTAALALIDPVWGGAYQYSVKNWKQIHFEKIAESQQRNLTLYSLAYLYFKDPRYLQAAKDVYRFLTTFLMSPEGAFYTSQDADLVPGQHSEGYFKLGDAQRRKKGLPRIDQHRYARENGAFVSALTVYYTANPEPAVLEVARRATDWVLANRALGDGGFRHDEKDPAGPYLGDTLEMANAFLSLYAVTAERRWLASARTSADFIQKHFPHTIDGKPAGYRTSESSLSAALPPTAERDENIRLARFANLLARYTGEKRYRAMAEQSMKLLAAPALATEPQTAGTLLVDKELADDPVHLTVVGKKSDPEAKTLYLTALAYPTSYKRIEWLDADEGPLPNPDTAYPKMAKAAVFACIKGRCSLPIARADELPARIDKLYQ